MKNAEGIEAFDIPSEFNIKNENGLGAGAMMRLRDEAEFIVPCLLAVRDCFDEIVIVLNRTTDRTRELIEALDPPNCRVFEYPFEIAFRGPDHAAVPPNSVHHSAYFYNWCLSKLRCNWAAKWDGDNVALPGFKNTIELIRRDTYDVIENCAWDLVGPALDMLGPQERVSYEGRVFRVGPGVRYGPSGNGSTQALNVAPRSRRFRQVDPTFLHLKWAKRNPTCYWPRHWREIAHFRAIADRHRPKRRYTGPYPQVLLDYLAVNKDPVALIEMYAAGRRDPLKCVARRE